MAAALGADLVFDLDGGDAAHLVFAHRAGRVEFVAVSGVAVRDHRDIDGPGQDAGRFRHLRQGQQPVVGVAVRRRHARAGHVHRVEPCLRHHAGGDPVICARCGKQAAGSEMQPQAIGCRHRVILPIPPTGKL